MIGNMASFRQRGQWERSAAGAALVALGLVLIAAPGLALAQSIGSSFQAYEGSSDEPINIEADMLEVDDEQKQAVFKGNVVARQGGFSLKARELAVYYTGQPAGQVAAASAGGSDGSITRIEAKGKVLVTTRDDQTATSEWAKFDVEKQVVTIGGNVVLSQGQNVLKGDRLVIDLKTGKSRFEVGNQSGKQRIRGLFQPKQD